MRKTAERLETIESLVIQGKFGISRGIDMYGQGIGLHDFATDLEDSGTEYSVVVKARDNAASRCREGIKVRRDGEKKLAQARDEIATLLYDLRNSS